MASKEPIERSSRHSLHSFQNDNIDSLSLEDIPPLPDLPTERLQPINPSHNTQIVQIPVPIYVPVPIPIKVPVPMPTNIPNQNISPVTSKPSSILPVFDSNVLQYIKQSNNLDFKATPCFNIYSPWLDNITINTSSKTAKDNFKVYLLKIATELGYDKYTKQQQLVLGEAIIKKESYIAGYTKPIYSSGYFRDKIWEKFEKSK